jgi:hypothetical protein
MVAIAVSPSYEPVEQAGLIRRHFARRNAAVLVGIEPGKQLFIAGRGWRGPTGVGREKRKKQNPSERKNHTAGGRQQMGLHGGGAYWEPDHLAVRLARKLH